MKLLLTVTCVLSYCYVLGAPQFTEKTGDNCHTEIVTIFEDTEAETVSKVVCQTEFRDSCTTRVEPVCRNVSTGARECSLVDRFNCQDSMTTKCGIEKVLKNVSYTETVCDTIMEDICEMELRSGVSVPVEGSCVSKPREICGPQTRFQEEFIDEEVCREIPIKDCENEKEEVCNEVQEEVCEDLETESCEVVPHEECRQITEKIPSRVSKKVTQVVCDNKEEKANMEDDEDIPSLKDILAIFGVTDSENEVDVDDSSKDQTTEASTTTSTPTSSTTTTTLTSTSTSTSTTTQTTTTTAATTTTTSTTTTSIVTESEFITTQPIRRMDPSKIIFSDAAISSRNKELSNRVYNRRIPTSSRPSVRVAQHNPHSQIFFPE